MLSEQLAAFRAVGVRKAHHATDNKPAAIRAQQRALDVALQSGVAFDVILAGRKAWAEAYDADKNDRRFLPAPADWLDARSWEEPPPKRGKQANGHAKGNGHYSRRRRGGRNDDGIKDLQAAAIRRMQEKRRVVQ